MQHATTRNVPADETQHAARVALAIARAHRDVPFYIQRQRAVPEAGESLADVLARTPLLSKRDVRATLPKVWAPAGLDLKAALASGAVERAETSGTTGERMRVLWDEGYWMRSERRAMRLHPRIARALDAALTDPAGYREAVLTTPLGGIGHCHSGDPLPHERTRGESLFLATRPDPNFWNAEAMDRMVDELEAYRAVGFEADPFFAAILARHAAAHGKRFAVDGFVTLTYASASRGDLRAIRQVYDGPVLQMYSATESGVMFVEGEDGLLHHEPVGTHVELLPAKVPTPGATDVALVVVTTLDRAVQPLVRFVLGDLVQVADGDATTLRSIEGRSEDALLRPDGALITAGALDRALDMPSLARFQATQQDAASVDVDLVCERGADAEATCRAAKEALEPLLSGLTLSLRTVQAVAAEPSGKFRLARRRFPLDLARTFEGMDGYSEEGAIS